jgi:hypothetical protein
VRARILAATRMSPPADTGLSRWLSREIASFIKRTKGVSVSHHYVAKLWRESGVKPHRHGAFTVTRDPAFAEKVADIIGLYLDPPGGTMVLSMDEKTQIQSLDERYPPLPLRTFRSVDDETPPVGEARSGCAAQSGDGFLYRSGCGGRVAGKCSI